MRIAADIGTNSIHMIVVQVRRTSPSRSSTGEKNGPAGCRGLDGKRHPEAMHAALQVLSKFRRLAESLVDEVIAVATAPHVKPKTAAIPQTVTQQTGIRPRVISGPKKRGSFTWRRCMASACRATSLS